MRKNREALLACDKDVGVEENDDKLRTDFLYSRFHAS
jgi:hypothetical protein